MGGNGRELYLNNNKIRRKKKAPGNNTKKKKDLQLVFNMKHKTLYIHNIVFHSASIYCAWQHCATQFLLRSIFTVGMKIIFVTVELNWGKITSNKGELKTVLHVMMIR